MRIKTYWHVPYSYKYNEIISKTELIRDSQNEKCTCAIINIRKKSKTICPVLVILNLYTPNIHGYRLLHIRLGFFFLQYLIIFIDCLSERSCVFKNLKHEAFDIIFCTVMIYISHRINPARLFAYSRIFYARIGK